MRTFWMIKKCRKEGSKYIHSQMATQCFGIVTFLFDLAHKSKHIELFPNEIYSSPVNNVKRVQQPI